MNEPDAILGENSDQRAQRENNLYQERLAQYSRENSSADPTYTGKKRGRNDDSDDDIDNTPLFQNRKRKRSVPTKRKPRKSDFPERFIPVISLVDSSEDEKDKENNDANDLNVSKESDEGVVKGEMPPPGQDPD